MNYIIIGFELVIGGILAWYAMAACFGIAFYLLFEIEEHRELIVLRIKQAVCTAIVLGAVAMFAAAHQGL